MNLLHKAFSGLCRRFRKPTEQEALRTDCIRMRAIADSALDAIVMMDSEGRISYWNPAAGHIFGFAESEAIGRNLHELLAPEAHHDASRKALAEFRHTGEGPAVGQTLELTARRRDGQDIPVSLSLSSVRIGDGWHAVGILRDTRERRKFEESLVQAKQETDRANLELEKAIEHANRLASKAQAAHIAKSRFLANMSHEIRTPMNGIMGMTELLLNAGLSDEQRRFAETLKTSADALLHVIEDILDFSKIESEDLDLETLDFDLRVTLEDLADVLGARCRDKAIEFICRIDPALPTLLRGDPARLRQILLNLGDNAVKFTAAGEIAVSAGLASEAQDVVCVRFEVRDSGIGIPAEKIDGLFEAFYQIDTSSTRPYGGTGLGLAIAKRLVEMMGGTIEVHSTEGKGSTFGFIVSFEKQPDRPEAEAASDDLRGIRILAVDDNATNRLVLGEQMASWGVRHTEVGSASKALDLLRKACDGGDPFRIAVIDMHMPRIDGEALGRAIKNDPLLKDTLLVMMTSAGRRGDVRRLEALGFSGYLTKPIKQSQLHDCLVDVLSGTRRSPHGESGLVTRFTIRESRRRKKGRILLAEDNAINREVARNILEKMGFRVDVADDGREAVRALERFPYALVFMDVQMPGMDGFEATRIIRSGSAEIADPAVPIIAMTAHALPGDRERCLAAGMDDYIAKPISPQDLENVLEKWLDPSKKEKKREHPAPKSPPTLKDNPVFDKKAFMARLMNDDQLAAQIVPGFIADMAEQMDILIKAAGRGHLEDVADQAHKIKGAAANVGGMAASAAAFLLEDAARRKKKTGIDDLVSRLGCQLRHLTSRLRKTFP